MLIKCNIVRDGDTIITLDKFKYVFTSRPELTGGDSEAKVCQVLSSSHTGYLLTLAPDFEAYVAEEAPPKQPEDDKLDDSKQADLKQDDLKQDDLKQDDGQGKGEEQKSLLDDPNKQPEVKDVNPKGSEKPAQKAAR